MNIIRILNFRKGLATNSSSTHSVIYRNEGEMLEDLNVMSLNYYDRYTETIAATREAKIKYILANVIYCKELAEWMLETYPETKEYANLAKKEINTKYDSEVFGMYTRGPLYVSQNIDFSKKFISELIENTEKVIIGGSDELDFFYDKTDGHQEAATPYGLCDYPLSVYKNGNYYVGFGWGDPFKGFDKRFTNKLRFSLSKEEPIAEFPELIDLKITEYCSHNCKMCFEGSSIKGKHADFNYLKAVVREMAKAGKIEYSIGGGNVLDYPELSELLSAIKEANGIACVTIKVDDVDRILNDEELVKLFKQYVRGVGVSVFTPDDIKKAEALHKTLYCYTVAHLIPEYLGVDKTIELLRECNGEYHCTPALLLGYKTLGRGKTAEWNELSEDEAKALFNVAVFDEYFLKAITSNKEIGRLSVDTLFAKRYRKVIDECFYTEKCLTPNEGEYSMYIDGVNQLVYKSSYEKEKPYKLEEITLNEIKNVFGNIREDNGFKRYEGD